MAGIFPQRALRPGMDAVQVSALREAAVEGVEFDDLQASIEGDVLVVKTPDGTWDGEGDVPPAVAPYVANWWVWHALAPQHEPRFRFLRWLEGADERSEPEQSELERSVPKRHAALEEGLSRTWGELHVAVRLGPGGVRQYEVRHAADEGADAAALETVDPAALEDLIRADADGRYRPLKTAPTLQSGWIAPELGPAACCDVVEAVYPATIANWHRERTGQLDVTHWRETAARQTGMFDVVSDLPDAAVPRVAEACCVDSQCLKRRQWDLDEDTELSVPRGEGEFPCREPCSLVIAAARKWATLEREPAETVTLEVTPAERDQLRDIVDAVADDRVDEIREADVNDGANRYRARYLREKLFGGPGEQDGDQGH
jgi:hypothetical protein